MANAKLGTHGSRRGKEACGPLTVVVAGHARGLRESLVLGPASAGFMFRGHRDSRRRRPGCFFFLEGIFRRLEYVIVRPRSGLLPGAYGLLDVLASSYLFVVVAICNGTKDGVIPGVRLQPPSAGTPYERAISWASPPASPPPCQAMTAGSLLFRTAGATAHGAA